MESGKSGPPLPTDIPLNCPACGARLAFVRAEGDIAVYRCPKDGAVVLPPNGRIQLQPH